jgi:hypothetical protein
VPYAELTDPQSLNQYSYVRNIPTSTADVTGHCIWDGCVAEVTLGVLFILSTLSTPTGQQALKAGVHAIDKATDWAAEQGNKALDAMGPACGKGNCVGEFQRMRPDQLNQNQSSDKSPGSTSSGNNGTSSSGGMKPGSAGGPGAGKKTTPKQRGETLQQNGGKCVVPGCDKPANIPIIPFLDHEMVIQLMRISRACAHIIIAKRERRQAMNMRNGVRIARTLNEK